MKRYSILIISASCIIIYLIFNSSKGNLPIEKIDICWGVSYDLITSSTMNEYSVAASAYTFPKKDEVSSVILDGIGKNLPDTRSSRQTLSSKESCDNGYANTALDKQLSENDSRRSFC